MELCFSGNVNVTFQTDTHEKIPHFWPLEKLP
jgi:hypothetical protein